MSGLFGGLTRESTEKHVRVKPRRGGKEWVVILEWLDLTQTHSSRENAIDVAQHLADMYCATLAVVAEVK